MSQIAVVTGIGRPMLYAYNPDIEAIVLAWHQREITVTSISSPTFGTRLLRPTSG